MDSDWRARKSSLVESLWHIFETGLFADVAFLVGVDKFRINAHKSQLSARSEPFSAMFHERWSSATTQEIKMPRNNKTPVKHFLKYLYTDIISFENVEIDDILEITHLAHMYQVHKLLDECIGHIAASINKKTCLQIHQSCQLLSKNLSDKALQFFLANVVATARSNDAYLTWDYDTIKKILQDDRQHLPEPILFKALLKWRNVDSERNKDFQKLITFIRFPTFSNKDFASAVVPSGVLSNEEIVEVFSYIATRSGSVKFPTEPRNPFIPSADNRKCVKICGQPGALSVIPERSFLQIFESPIRNFHSFRLTIRNTSEAESYFTFPQTTDIKLYGIKFFNSYINNSDLTAYLRARRVRIKVTVTDDRRESSKVIEKTITELTEQQMQAYFESPLIISWNRSYWITTSLTPTTRTGWYFPTPDVTFQLPQQVSSLSQQLFNFDGISGKFMIERFEGSSSYSLIDELLFSRPELEEPLVCTECNIS